MLQDTPLVPNSTTEGSASEKRSESLKNFYYRYGLNHLLKVSILISYSFLGATVLYLSEHNAEVFERSQAKFTYDRHKKQLVERIWELKISNFSRAKVANLSLSALGWYEKSLLNTTCKMDISALDRPYKWDFWSAVFFTGTVYTTIGYGDITPVTQAGRWITIVYALFGIPVFIFILNDMGIFVSTVLYRAWNFSCLCLGKVCRKSGKVGRKSDLPTVATDQYGNSLNPSQQLHLLPISFALVSTILWMLMCSGLFCQWEDSWNFFDAFYFVFVSLTTVGLGDTVPQRIDYMLMSFGLVIVGLSLVSMCIKVAEAKLDHLGQQMQEKIMQNYQAAQLQGEGAVMDMEAVQKGLNQMGSKWLKPLMRRRNCDLQVIIRQCVKMKIKSTQTATFTENRATQTVSSPTKFTQSDQKQLDADLIKSFLREIITWRRTKTDQRRNGVQTVFEPNNNNKLGVEKVQNGPDWLDSIKFIDSEDPLPTWIEEVFANEDVKKLLLDTSN